MDNKDGIKLFGATISIQETKQQLRRNEDDEKSGDQMKRIGCPRCKSMETKFCYFNNYNVNQPRHFCKGCHRYWTAGGALRNVPVGAGRRKNKPPLPTNIHQHYFDLQVINNNNSVLLLDNTCHLMAAAPVKRPRNGELDS